MNLEQRVDKHEELLLGKDGEPGLTHKVGFMWRIHVWLIGLIGIVGGYSMKWFADILGAHLGK